MKKFLLLFLSMLTTLWSYAYDYRYNNLYYNLDAVTRTATLTYASTSYNSYSGSVSIPEVITSEKGIDYDVVAIGPSAFRNCTGLTSVTIPATIEEIGDHAFYGCSSITTIKVPALVETIGAYAFAGCTKLTSVTLPKNYFKVLNEGTFQNCSALTSVTIPSNVTSIGNKAFQNCSKLASVSISTRVTTIGDYAFDGCSLLASVSVPASVTSIGAYAFQNCAKMTSVSLTSGLQTIKNDAFRGCTTLATISLPGTVTSLGSNAFYGDTALANAVLSSGLTSIADGTFYNCSSLPAITIPAKVKSVGSTAFSGCTKLKTIAFAEGMTTIPRTYATYITNIKFPSTVTALADKAFYGCAELPRLVLPATLTSIGTEAFAGCNNLIELEYAEGTRTALRTYATKLTTVTIPGTCSAFADGIFDGCTALTVVNISDLEMWNFIFLGLDKSPFACPRSIYLNGEILMDLIADFGAPVANYAFANVKGLESVTLTGSISDIQPYAFTNSTELRSVTMGNRVKSIGNNAFAGCTALQSAQLGSGVTSIETSAFEGCSSLNSMRMGGRETSIGSRVFYGCESLQDLKLPTSVTAIGSYAFYNCYNLAKLNIPDAVTTIPAYAFYNCRALEGITLPAGVKQIGTYAFNGCTTLDKIEIPDATTIIGDYAFNGCSKVREARLGAGVTSIGSYAFANCSYLINFYIAAAAVPSTNSTAFNGTLASGTSVSEVVLYVPDGSLSAYRAAAPWSSFANILGLANAPVYVTRLTISPEALILEPDGDSGTFTAIPTPANASNISLTWSTSNAEVATVTKRGIVLTDMEGVATITATAKDGNGARARAVVISTYNFVPVTSVRLDATTLTLTEGDEHHLTATASPSTATYPEVYWTSSNEKVLTVSEDGLLTAIAAGTATITARSADGTGRTATCRVTVNEPTYSSLTTLGDADNDGFVTTSDIQAVTNLLLGNRGGIDRSCDVNNDGHVGIGDVAVVIDALKNGSAVPAGPVKVIRIDGPTEVGPGESGELCAITVPAHSAVNVEWSCSDESILRLDSKKGGVCRFTAIATGRVVVTASSDGQKANLIIDVCSGTKTSFEVNGVTFNMKLVEHGTFQMGKSADGSDVTPVHSETISNDYYIGETEVTQALWYAVMGKKPTSDGSKWSSDYGLGDDYPAYYISWNDCQSFITKLNALTGQNFRLPTEAEWEFAAKGGNMSQGYNYSGSNTIDDVAWYMGNSGGKTHPVATKQPNELGLYDMSGNVWELCSDKSSSGSEREGRGGSWWRDASYCRVAYRSCIFQTSRSSYIGFRLALSPSL